MTSYDELDQLLTNAAPDTATRSLPLSRDLQQLVVQARSEAHGESSIAASRPSRRRRAAFATLAAAGVIGMGTVGAAAISGGATWFTTTSSGSSCEMEYDIKPIGPAEAANGEPATILAGNGGQWPSAAEQEATASAARSYLAAYDFNAIDRDTAIAVYDETQRDIIDAAPVGEKQPLLTGDDLEMTAVSRVVIDDLASHLTTTGHYPNSVSVSIGSSAGCSDE